MNHRIIRANAAHLDALGTLFDAYRQFYGQPADLAGARAFLEARLANDESVIFIAEGSRGGAGFTQLYPLFTSVGMRRVWLLNDLFVAPSARRSGVATMLMEAAHAHARETRAAGVILETQINNREAQSLYEKLGYRRNETTWFYELKVNSDQ